MAALQGRLGDFNSLNNETRSAIVNSLWPRYAPEKLDDLQNYDWSPYFNYYVNQCRHSLQDQSGVPRTHDEIIKVSYLLRKNASRESMKEQLGRVLKRVNNESKETIGTEGTNVIEEKVSNIINLVTRLYFMLNVGTAEATFTTARTKLQWTDGSPREFLLGHFKHSKSLHDISVRFDKSFTARNIERIAGITIQWTDNLADHLRILDAEDKTVAIFHYASFLRHQATPVFPPFFPPLFPAGLIEETLRTLALLFPQHDRDTSKWLQVQSKHSGHGIDQQLLKCGHLRLKERQKNNFHFWHDRLIILKQAYDDSRPKTLSQWWIDRRNTVQWYTFWVAIVILLLTIFFGLVQSIEGALQVYKAYNPTVA